MRPASTKHVDSPNMPVFPMSAMGPNSRNHVSLLRNINSVDVITSLCILFMRALFDMSERDLRNMMELELGQFSLS